MYPQVLEDCKARSLDVARMLSVLHVGSPGPVLSCVISKVELECSTWTTESKCQMGRHINIGDVTIFTLMTETSENERYVRITSGGKIKTWVANSLKFLTVQFTQS